MRQVHNSVSSVRKMSLDKDSSSSFNSEVANERQNIPEMTVFPKASLLGSSLCSKTGIKRAPESVIVPYFILC